MSTHKIIQAWKDQDYRNSLPEAEAAALPAHPAGTAVLSDEALRSVSGGAGVRTAPENARFTHTGCCALN